MTSILVLISFYRPIKQHKVVIVDTQSASYDAGSVETELERKPDAESFSSFPKPAVDTPVASSGGLILS